MRTKDNYIVSWIEEYMGCKSRKCEICPTETEANAVAIKWCHKYGAHGDVLIAQVTTIVEPGAATFIRL